MNLCCKLALILSYFTPKFVEIECHLHRQKNRSTLAKWGGGGGWLPTSIFSLILGPRRNVRSKEILMDRYPKDEPVAKHLVYRKSSSHSPEKVEKPGWRGVTPANGIGRLRMKINHCFTTFKIQSVSFMTGKIGLGVHVFTDFSIGLS